MAGKLRLLASQGGAVASSSLSASPSNGSSPGLVGAAPSSAATGDGELLSPPLRRPFGEGVPELSETPDDTWGKGDVLAGVPTTPGVPLPGEASAGVVKASEGGEGATGARVDVDVNDDKDTDPPTEDPRKGLPNVVPAKAPDSALSPGDASSPSTASALPSQTRGGRGRAPSPSSAGCAARRSGVAVGGTERSKVSTLVARLQSTGSEAVSSSTSIGAASEPLCISSGTGGLGLSNLLLRFRGKRRPRGWAGSGSSRRAR